MTVINGTWLLSGSSHATVLLLNVTFLLSLEKKKKKERDKINVQTDFSYIGYVGITVCCLSCLSSAIFYIHTF